MFFDILHKHYWGPPRRCEDGAYYMTCYECGKRRRLRINIDDEPEKRVVTAIPNAPEKKTPRAA
jgi:hypothetical protein